MQLCSARVRAREYLFCTVGYQTNLSESNSKSEKSLFVFFPLCVVGERVFKMRLSRNHFYFCRLSLAFFVLFLFFFYMSLHSTAMRVSSFVCVCVYFVIYATPTRIHTRAPLLTAAAAAATDCEAFVARKTTQKGN